jgi:hypothetical protein
MIRCKKCLKEFPENKVELSHHIPKYMGGTDKDGRSYLCLKHHDDYEELVLVQCYLKVFNLRINLLNDRRSRIPKMGFIKLSSETIKEKCRKIALQCKEEFYSKGEKRDDTTTTMES